MQKSLNVTRRTFAGMMGAAGALAMAGGSLTLSGSANAEESDGVSFTPGTYTVETSGMSGTFEISAEFSDNTLESIEVGENEETLAVGTAALDILSNRMVDQQTINCEAVTGATYSSMGIIVAMEELVKQADGDVKAFSETEAVIPTYENEPHDADIIIVGGGLAGSCCAISAAQNGANVILLEALQFAAGNSTLSTGSFLMGGTELQKSVGIDLTADDYYNYLMEGSDYQKDPDQIRIMADNCENLVEWFDSIGITFSDAISNNYSHPISPSIGAAIEIMNQTMVDLGVAIHYATKANDFLFDDNGAVIGVKATDYYGNDVEYTGKKVILCSGGYGDNPELIGETWGEEYSKLTYGGLKGMDGTMLIAAVNAGADTTDMEWPHIDACLDYNKGVTLTTNITVRGGGIIIRTDGKRFADESLQHAEVAAAAMHELGDEYFYEIFDPRVAEHDYPALVNKFNEYMAMGLPTIYDTIEDMAKDLDIDLDTLTETIDNYNAAVRGEQEDEFGRTTFYVTLDGPFYVIKVSNGIACTTGGLKVDTDNHVISTDGDPIENLYAIGETAGGALVGYVGGESLTHSAIGGMLCGKYVADEVTA